MPPFATHTSGKRVFVMLYWTLFAASLRVYVNVAEQSLVARD
jgi:hypothetical protein